MTDPTHKGVREHFGQGKLALDPNKSVFINCPFDEEFSPILDAILFATVCCGFIPRSALESGNVAQPRMERITRAIFSSKYSIHDLSRCRGEGNEQLARFNMPLELGIAMAHQFLGTQESQRHDWLLLVPEGHIYLQFISDLAGFDPMRYDGRAESIVPRLMAWLATRPDATRTSTPQEVLARLPEFKSNKAGLQQAWGGHAPWADLVRVAIEIYETMF